MPTFSKFKEQGFDLTESEVKRLEREIIKIYREAQKELASQIKSVYSKLAGISAEDSGYYNELLKYNRLSKILADVQKTYSGYITKADLTTVTASKVAITNNYYRQMYASSWADTVTFGALPEVVVELSVYGSEEAWKAYTASVKKKFGDGSAYQPKEGTLASILFNNRRKQQEALRQTITQGLIQGWSEPKMAAAVNEIIGRELVKDGKRVYTGGKASAVRIVRTETTRTMNAGSFALSMLLKSQGVKAQKRWLASLDMRTRSAHAGLDGVTIDVDEYFTIGSDRALHPGDFDSVKNNVNCRCTVIDVLPDFEPTSRTGRNPITGKSELLSWQTFDEWAKTKNLKRTKSGRLVAA